MTQAAKHRSGGRLPGAAGLGLRQFTADPWVSLSLALMVVVVVFGATLWPRFVLQMNSDQVPHEVNELSATRQDMIAHSSTTVTPLPGMPETVEGAWGPLEDNLDRVREEQPEPLRSMLRPAQFLVNVDQATPTGPPGEDSDIATVNFQQRVDPFLQDHVELVEGDWPAFVVDTTSYVGVDDQGGVVISEVEEVTTADPTPVLLLDEAAERLGWEVGETFGTWVLSGTYRPVDAKDGRWEHHTNGASMGVMYDGNLGNLAFATLYLNPANPGSIGGPAVASFEYWYPIDAAAVAGDQVDLVTSQLLGMASSDVTLQDEDPTTGASAVRARFSSEVVGTFQELSAQQRATASMLAVVAAGPIGVTLAVFALAARLIVTRRRYALSLVSARGGSPRQVRGLLALEGVLLGMPAAAAGYLLAGLVRPVSTGWSELVLAALAGLVPAAALALSARESSLRETRSDLGSRSSSRLRWIVETIVVALAAIAVWRLIDRGLTSIVLPAEATSTPGAAGAVAAPVDAGVDLLMAATPVLLALAACVLTLRLYPVPVLALSSVFRRRTDLIPFLGSARSVRDPAGGLIPALAVILGVGVAVFSTLMSSTIEHGAESAAWNQTGAQIRMSGPQFDADLMERIGEIDGVRAVSGIRQAGRSADLSGDVSQTGVSIYVVDSNLPDVQAGAPDLTELPPALFEGGGATPILTGGAVEGDSGSGSLTNLGAVTVVGHVDGLPGMRTDRAFVVVDRTLWEQAGARTTPATVALVDVTDPDQREQVATAIGEEVSNALVETPLATLDAFRSAPVTSGLGYLFTAAVVITTALTVLAILVVQLMGAPARAKLLAVLRTLGLRPGQGRSLTAWELGPLLAMAFAVGAVLGVAIPWLLLKAIDLTGMTGGQQQPTLHLDWAQLGLVVGAILVAVLLAVAVSAAAASRTNLAQQLRVGEER